MEDKKIQYENENLETSAQSSSRTSLIDFLIKRGWAKDEQQAIYILLVIVILVFLFSVFLISIGGESSVPAGELYYGGPQT